MNSSVVLAFELALAEVLIVKGVIDKDAFIDRISELRAKLRRATNEQVEEVIAEVLGKFVE